MEQTRVRTSQWLKSARKFLDAIEDLAVVTIGCHETLACSRSEHLKVANGVEGGVQPQYVNERRFGASSSASTILRHRSNSKLLSRWREILIFCKVSQPSRDNISRRVNLGTWHSNHISVILGPPTFKVLRNSQAHKLISQGLVTELRLEGIKKNDWRFCALTLILSRSLQQSSSKDKSLAVETMMLLSPSQSFSLKSSINGQFNIKSWTPKLQPSNFKTLIDLAAKTLCGKL